MVHAFEPSDGWLVAGCLTGCFKISNIFRTMNGELEAVSRNSKQSTRIFFFFFFHDEIIFILQFSGIEPIKNYDDYL